MFTSFTWLSVYGDEGGTGGTTPPESKVEEKPGAKFTQDDVNKFVAEERRKLQKQNTELATQLETVKQNANLTAQEREDLQQRIEALQSQFMTKEELAKSEFDKQQKKSKADLEAATGEARKWQGAFSTLFVTNEIRKASADNNAFSGEQMVDYLLPRAELAQQVDDSGKPTGGFVAVVPFTDEKEGKTLKMPIGDAMKKMRELPDRYGNFFKGEGVSGSGLTNQGKGSADVGEFREDMTADQYAAWRKKVGIAK
jgi:hypothetical protein